MKIFILKFKNAILGVVYAFQGLSFVVQLVAGVIVAFMAFYFPIANFEKAILFVVIFLVLALEMFNSSIERLADRLIPEDDVEIKFVKDLAAGAVLVFSIGAAAVGVIIIGPHIANFILSIK